MTGINSRRSALVSTILWILSLLITAVCFTYQDKTGPTYPLDGWLRTAKGPVHFRFLRSETIGTTLKIMLLDPIPSGITGYVKFRRYKSNDAWSSFPFHAGEFEYERRGRKESVKGAGVELPTLNERAGKYEYYVYISDGVGEPVSVTDEEPIYARYKAAVPTGVLVIHILVIFASMMFAVRTGFEAVADGNCQWMLWATTVSLVLGAFVLGPLVQWYVFGVWWSGIPFGYDWTDNKVLLELAAWVGALFLNRGNRRNRRSVYVAAAVTLVVYFIPHSVFGSEYNYTTGTGHGTAG